MLFGLPWWALIPIIAVAGGLFIEYRKQELKAEEKKKQEDERKKAEEKRLAEEKKQQEENKLAEQKKLELERRLALQETNTMSIAWPVKQTNHPRKPNLRELRNTMKNHCRLWFDPTSFSCHGD